MDPPHQIHHIKPKIAKNASSKLPEAFRMQAPVSKRASEPLSEEPKPPASETKTDAKRERKSKNPFLPIKEFIKKAEEFSREMREANNDLNSNDRFAKYSIQGEKGRPRYKYQNCLTLSVVRKNPNGCLKKVLHVPTLTVHYLKESLISTHFDKGELMEWIQVVNREEQRCMGILQLFWNMPEDYYSLLYQYSEGLLLDSLNEALHTIPVPLLRDIALLHLGVSVAVFNSHIILHQEQDTPIIRYLPLYEESEFTLSEMLRLKQIMEVELGHEETTKIGRRFSWRLGLLLLNGYIGTPILSQEILNVQLPLTKCCLFHEMLTASNSLTSIYLEVGQGLDLELADFLCICLRSKKNAESSMELRRLRRHKWFSKSYNQIITLGELVEVVDPTISSQSKFQLNKMSRILDSVGLILQNVSGVELTISSESKGVKHLARELGMGGQIEQMVSALRKVYRSELN